MDMPINRLPTSNFDAERARITHVVIPFHKEEESKLFSNLQLWSRFPPCPTADIDQKTVYRSDTGHSSIEPFFLNEHHPAGPLGRDVSLMFFCSSDFDPDLETRLVKVFSSLPQTVQQCFKTVGIRFGDIIRFKGKGGTMDNRMILHMMHGKLGLINPYYVLYMNPQLLPIRPNWLVTLDALTRWPSRQFWIRSSLPRHEEPQKESPKDIKQALTMSVNAIYNLGDPNFHHFCKNFLHAKLFNKDNFNLALLKQLVNFSDYQMSISLAHLFQYTESIYDVWPSDYSASELKAVNEITVLVHGRNQKP